jgi:hypothetical protein
MGKWRKLSEEEVESLIRLNESFALVKS